MTLLMFKHVGLGFVSAVLLICPVGCVTFPVDHAIREGYLAYTIPSDAVPRATTTVQPAGEGCDRVVVRRIEYFTSGTKVGEVVETDHSRTVIPMMAGERHGVTRVYFGKTLVEETPFFKGRMHGVCKRWNLDGRFLGLFRMTHGTGIVKEWDAQGALRKELHYKGGELCLELFHGGSDLMFSETPYKNGVKHGPASTWWPNGRLCSEVPYVHGREHGTERSWNEDGTLWRETRYREGRADGEWRYFHSNGRLQYSHWYEDGRMHGKFRQWTAAGQLLGEFDMTAGSGVLWEWDDDGGLIDMVGYGRPQCYLNGEEVDRDYYISAAQKNQLLPRFEEPRRAGQ